MFYRNIATLCDPISVLVLAKHWPWNWFGQTINMLYESYENRVSMYIGTLTAKKYCISLNKQSTQCLIEEMIHNSSYN